LDQPVGENLQLFCKNKIKHYLIWQQKFIVILLLAIGISFGLKLLRKFGDRN